MNEVTTSYVLKITFIKSDGSAYVFNVDDYKRTLEDDDIAEAANAILAENVFAPGGLSLIKADHAVKVVTTKTPVEWEE